VRCATAGSTNCHHDACACVVHQRPQLHGYFYEHRRLTVRVPKGKHTYAPQARRLPGCLALDDAGHKPTCRQHKSTSWGVRRQVCGLNDVQRMQQQQYMAVCWCRLAAETRALQANPAAVQHSHPSLLVEPTRSGRTPPTMTSAERQQRTVKVKCWVSQPTTPHTDPVIPPNNP
jgi:hypothetical protein